jgi:flotillin
MNQFVEALPAAMGTGVVLIAVVLGLMAVVKYLMHICRPNEILVFSGRPNVLADGRKVGFRVVFGGRAFRMPVLETVNRMDISLITVPMTVQGAYSEGGIPLNMHAIANVKVSSNPKLVGNAIERFLGRGRADIGRVAKETLEGHLRGVLATMTPEEVNQDRLKFAEQLSNEAEADLSKLGLEIDTLKIQHVSDDRNYLESIGRKRIAEILAEAEVSESDAQRSAEEAEAATGALGQVALTRAQANIQRKQNELRQIRAELHARARAEEERASGAALEARATAERELQQIRGELEELRLAADVTIPADVGRRVQELNASGMAARIFTDGEAMAESLRVIAKAWRESGAQAMDMFVLQNLEDIFGEVATAASKVKVGHVNLIDAGDGKTLPAYASAFPATVGALFEQVSRTLGVDIPRIMAGNGHASGAPAAPAKMIPAVPAIPAIPASASASAAAPPAPPAPPVLPEQPA